MIKAVFFDIDDTLLSFSDYVREAMREGFHQYGLKPYEESMFLEFRSINNALWRRIEAGTLTLPELRARRWNDIFAALGIDFDGPTFETYFAARLFESAIPEPHAHEVLEALKGRYILCVASNGPYAQQLNRLRLAGMDETFDYLFVSSELGASKPSRAFFERSFAALRDVNPDEALIIGDSPSSDIAGGRAYGMKTCLYTRHGARETDDADYCVDDLIEIKAILAN